jgi:hypothetical protein
MLGKPDDVCVCAHTLQKMATQEHSRLVGNIKSQQCNLLYKQALEMVMIRWLIILLLSSSIQLRRKLEMSMKKQVHLPKP